MIGFARLERFRGVSSSPAARAHGTISLLSVSWTTPSGSLSCGRCVTRTTLKPLSAIGSALSQPAEQIAGQIARRPDLQEAATVPLLLAFFCIVGGGAPLPELGSDLYAKVINRLLTGRWRGRHDRHPDIRACLAALRAWAWSGIARHPVTGLGIWEDEISCESAGLLEVDSDAVDHVATPMSPPDVDSGKIMRQVEGGLDCGLAG